MTQMIVRRPSPGPKAFEGFYKQLAPKNGKLLIIISLDVAHLFPFDERTKNLFGKPADVKTWVDELRHGLFLSFAVICAVGLCFVMLKLMADVKEGKNEVSTLQSQLNEQLNVNAEYSSGLDSMTDLDEIYKIATTELGMVYSKPGQTVYYPQNSDDYVIQYKNVPETK